MNGISFELGSSSLECRNDALNQIMKDLDSRRAELFEANKKDLKAKPKIKKSLLDRLKIDDKKIDEMIESIRVLIEMDDPLNQTLASTLLTDGLELYKVTTPIGVIGVIFESRPDALVQISTLCIKSGNAVLLKGGSEAKNTNLFLVSMIREAILGIIPKDAVKLLETREDVKAILSMDDEIDLLIPRGSNELVQFIKSNTKIPVLGHADGVCHAYVDKDCEADLAVDVCYDAKCQYPAVCNAIETMLVHRRIADRFLPLIAEKFSKVEIRGCEKTKQIIDCKKATEKDWKTEYNDLVISIKVVDDIEHAIMHINKYGSHHTDVIITEDEDAKMNFIRSVDSSSVMHNCSTRFADGFRYGFGAEIGISTGKIHARGPVGLDGLLIHKYVLVGEGHTVGGVKDYKHEKLEKEFEFDSE